MNTITPIATRIACGHGLLESRVQKLIDMAETARQLSYDINCLDFGNTAYQGHAYGDAQECCIKLLTSLLYSMNKDEETTRDNAFDIVMECIDNGESVAYNLTLWMENNS